MTGKQAEGRDVRDKRRSQTTGWGAGAGGGAGLPCGTPGCLPAELKAWPGRQQEAGLQLKLPRMPCLLGENEGKRIAAEVGRRVWALAFLGKVCLGLAQSRLGWVCSEPGQQVRPAGAQTGRSSSSRGRASKQGSRLRWLQGDSKAGLQGAEEKPFVITEDVLQPVWLPEPCLH